MFVGLVNGVLFAALVGILVPLGFNRFGVDPAVAATVFVATDSGPGSCCERPRAVSESARQGGAPSHICLNLIIRLTNSHMPDSVWRLIFREAGRAFRAADGKRDGVRR